jgi:WD40 repeat protein
MIQNAEPHTMAIPFRSLDELRRRHDELAHRMDENDVAPRDVVETEAFIRRAAATGAVLDTADERRAAQALINFWNASLDQSVSNGEPNKRHMKSENSLLAPFDAELLARTVIGPADAWIQSQSDEDQILARRIILRLLRLRKDGQHFEVRQNTQAVCDDLQPHEQADAVLRRLVDLGLIRVTHNPSGREEFALRSATLLNRWPRLLAWMNERRQIRAKASQWEQEVVKRSSTDRPKRTFAQSTARRVMAAVKNIGAWLEALRSKYWPGGWGAPHSILTDQEFAEAETYRDWDAAELKLVYEQRQLDKEKSEWYRAGLGLAATKIVLLFIVSVVAVWGWVVALNAKQTAERAKEMETVRKWSIQTTCLTGHAKQALAGEPQQGALLALEAWKHIKDRESQGDAESQAQLKDAKDKALATLRLALASIDGIGYHAEKLGSITEVAVLEKANRLRWLAASDALGSIALWDFADPHATVVKTLPFGYAPPIRKLLITKDEKYLVALNFQNNLTIWNLDDPELPCRVFKTVATEEKPDLGIPPQLRISHDQKWLQIDDDRTEGKFIYLGDLAHGPKEFSFSLVSLNNSRVSFSLPNFSFSRDGRWFARIASNGVAYMWDLKKVKEESQTTPIRLDDKSVSPGQTVNGEFMNDSDRLVVFLTDGTARYWDLNEKTDKWSDAKVVDLKVVLERASKMEICTQIWPKILTNRRGTHVILIPRTTPDAYCFDGHELHNPKAIHLTEFDEKGLVPPLESDATGQFLLARYLSNTVAQNESLRIWDLKSSQSKDREKVSQYSFVDGIRDVKIFPSGVFLRGNGPVHWLELPPKKGRLPEKLRGIDGPVQVLAAGQSGNRILAGGQFGDIRAWELSTLKSTDLRKTIAQTREAEVDGLDPSKLEQQTSTVVGRLLRKAEWDRLDLGDDPEFKPVLSKVEPPPAQPSADPLKGKPGLLHATFDLANAKSQFHDKFGPAQNPKAAEEFMIDLEKEKSYVINMRSTTIDSYLVLVDPTGEETARDDDSGIYPDARIRYQCKKAGKYKIIATSYDGAEKGEFRLSVSEVNVTAATDELNLTAISKLEFSGQLTKDSDDSGEGPLMALELKLPDTAPTVQLDLFSMMFVPTLRLESSDGQKHGEARAIAGRARLVFNADPILSYRVVVLGKHGNAKAFQKGQKLDFKLVVEQR